MGKATNDCHIHMHHVISCVFCGRKKHTHGGTYVHMKGKPAETNDNTDLLLSGASPPEVSFLGNCQFGTLALRQRYPRLSALTDNKDIGDSIIANVGGHWCTRCILSHTVWRTYDRENP